MRFEGEKSSLDIEDGPDGIKFTTNDIGNASSALISYDTIWDVIDYLIDIAGPRTFA